MRTNIVIDEKLISKAMKLTGLTTKKAVVEEALQTLIRLKQQKEIRKLKGAAKWDGDLEKMRRDK